MGRKLLWLCLLTAGITAGCTPLSSKYFEASTAERICEGKYCFVPRIVAYMNIRGDATERANDNFWMSLKVYDTIPAPPDSSQLLSNMDVRRSVADEFRERVLSDIRMDSVVLRVVEGRSIWSVSVAADERKYEPRDVNYLSFNFGSLVVGDTVKVVDFVFHYQHLQPGGNQPDSVVFPMERIVRETRSPFEGLIGDDDLRGI